MFRKHCFSIVILCSLVLFFDVQLAAAEEWENIGVEDGVHVSRMQVEGSPMLAFRGVTVADVHISKIVEVFLDTDHRQHWVDRYHSHQTLERSDSHEVYRIRFDLPIGISDRDYVLRADLEINESKNEFVARIKSVTDSRAPENRCCVRAFTETYYKFTAYPGEDRTHMIVEVHTDPRGRLPTWLVNRIQSDWPSKTLSGLINRASASGIQSHPDYQDW